MKKNIRYILAAVAIGMASHTMGQNLNSAYFMEGYVYGHELNPAQDFERKGYVSMPFILSNMNTSFRGNLGLKNLFYKDPTGQHSLVTYLHPEISSSEAMGNLHQNNKLLSDIRYELLSVGFHGLGGYNTIGIGVRANVGMNVPYDLFDLTKNLTNKNYDISNFGATATSWVEIGLGHSRQVTDDIRIGAKAKLLLGVARAELKMDNLKLNLADENQWTATANATLEASVKNLSWGETETKEYNNQYPGHTTYQQIDLGNTDVDHAGLGGAGFAVDLGAEWKMDDIVEGMKLSAALLDLGFIHWGSTLVAQNRGEEFKFEGFNNIAVDDGPGTELSDQTDDLGDRLSDLYSLQDGGKTSVTRALGATLNIGLEYKLPAYDKLRFGFLSTTRMQGKYSWNEERLSANISPIKFLEGGINLGVGTLGTSFGWIVNLHPRGFNLFMGMDHIFGKTSKQGVPLKTNADFTIGINFPFGSRMDI